MINYILHNLLNNRILVYINNILIYTEIIEEHDRLVLDMLKFLRRNNLIITPEKCKWYVQEIKFLGYIISSSGIKIFKNKTNAIENW